MDMSTGIDTKGKGRIGIDRGNVSGSMVVEKKSRSPGKSLLKKNESEKDIRIGLGAEVGRWWNGDNRWEFNCKVTELKYDGKKSLGFKLDVVNKSPLNCNKVVVWLKNVKKDKETKKQNIEIVVKEGSDYSSTLTYKFEDKTESMVEAEMFLEFHFVGTSYTTLLKCSPLSITEEK